jgi:hypothetical protein
MLGVKAMIWHPCGGFPFSPDAGVGWHCASARATCLADMLPDGQPSHHTAPDEDCNCGIHALYGMGFLMEYLSLPDVAFYGRCRSRLFTAILEAFGKVIEHEYGWRAEAATIVAVTSSADLACSLDSDAPQRQAAAFMGVPLLRGSEVYRVLADGHVASLVPLRFQAEEGLSGPIRAQPGCR